MCGGLCWLCRKQGPANLHGTEAHALLWSLWTTAFPHSLGSLFKESRAQQLSRGAQLTVHGDSSFKFRFFGILAEAARC